MSYLTVAKYMGSYFMFLVRIAHELAHERIAFIKQHLKCCFDQLVLCFQCIYQVYLLILAKNDRLPMYIVERIIF